MTERKEVDPYLLTPEYWDGHEPGDDCEPPAPPNYSIRKELQQERTMRKPKKFAKETMLDFLAKPEQDRTPIRVFKKGETFDASEFPPGTVVGFGREQLGTAKDLPYYSGRSWGIVVSYEEDGEIKRRIIRYNANLIDMNAEIGTSPLLGVYGSYQSPQIKVGDVKHGLRGFMSRVTNLAVYEVGKGVKQEEMKKSLLPGWGVLFPKPQPGGA